MSARLEERDRVMRPYSDEFAGCIELRVQHPEWESLMPEALKKIPPEIGIQFKGHGIDNSYSGYSGTEEDIHALLRLLSQGLSDDDFYTAPLYVDKADATLVQATFGYAYLTLKTRGSFILVGRRLDPHFIQGNKLNPCAVIVAKHCYPLVPSLSAAFPRVMFVKVEELDSKDSSQYHPLQDILDYSLRSLGMTPPKHD